jgi:hypothetical protein
LLITMYDDVNLGLIPAYAGAVAGYVNGKWANYAAVVKRWPKVAHLSIAVNASADADCLDVERGDAVNTDAPAWVKRQVVRGVKRPVIYTSVSNVKALLAVLSAAGIPRSGVRLWTAHYTFRAHLCTSACGFGMPTTADGTQFTDKALGRSLDQSVLAADFFGAGPAPKPVPPSRGPAISNDPYVSMLRSQDDYWSWVQWRLGEGAWFGYGSQNPTVRPNVPKTIPIRWRLRLYAFVGRRHVS